MYINFKELYKRCFKRRGLLTTQTILVMKLTAILMFVACLQVSARGFGQTITLSLKDVSLEKIFKEIKKQAGYNFIYSKEQLENTKAIDISVTNEKVEDVLALCFKDQPITYIIEDNYVVVKNKDLSVSIKTNSDPNTIEVKGKIINANGEPVSNAYIIVKQSKRGTISNANGEFAMKNVKIGDVLIITHIGYNKKSVSVTEKNFFALVLEPSSNTLDDVVVQAYGTTSQRFSTGDIGVVTAKEIEKQPVMNPLMALQGRVAGLDIQQNNGYASGPIKVEIRGRPGVDPNQVSDPLYIIDGVPLTVLETSGRSNYGQSVGFLQNGYLTGPAGGQSPLFSINPSDIESISVLKDADATSIYGSRGANGVILITTKRGRPGKSNFSIHVDEGINKITRFWKMLNTQQYLTMRREAFRNDGIMPDAANAPDLFLWDSTRNIDWQKEIFGKAGKVVNAQISLSGGDAQTTFRIGAAYTHSEEITTASGADQRGSISVNLSHSTSNRKFNMTFASAYSFTQSDMVKIPGTVTFAPNAPPIYDSSGHLNWLEWESSGVGFPFGPLLQTYTSKTNFLNSNMSLSYQPIRGLSVKMSVGYNSSQANQLSLIPIASQNPKSQPTGTAQFGFNTNKNWIVEPQINYETQIWKGNLTALIGGSAQQNTTDGVFISGTGYTSDALLRTISNAPSQSSSDIYGAYRYASIFGRLGYNISNKYIVNLNIRRDGSSNYGPGNQFGNFASIGAAWLFTEENWFKEHISFLSFGKLRGSYGLAGSDGGTPYGYITRWSSASPTYLGIVPLVATQHANPDYHWQENRKLEGAIDLGFFKDWVTVSVAYYRNRTNNQLLPYPTPLLSGFSTVIDNLNALVENTGWEFTLSGKGIHVHSKFFNWDWAPHFNFSINQNRFVSFTGLASSPFRNQGLIGKPLNGLYILHFTGVDPQTGAYTYQDMNHDGVINPIYGPTGDVYFRKISPTFSTGFGFNFDLQGFNLSLFFYLKKQTGINAIAQGISPGNFNANQPVEVLGRWQKPGDKTNIGKFSTVGAQDPSGLLAYSDIGYTDASYIRLQNLSISYNLTDNLIKKASFKCFIYFHASNLFTITKYKGIDPETQNFGGMPPARTMVGGISFEF